MKWVFTAVNSWVQYLHYWHLKKSKAQPSDFIPKNVVPEAEREKKTLKTLKKSVYVVALAHAVFSNKEMAQSFKFCPSYNCSHFSISKSPIQSWHCKGGESHSKYIVLKYSWPPQCGTCHSCFWAFWTPRASWRLRSSVSRKTLLLAKECKFVPTREKASQYKMIKPSFDGISNRSNACVSL